MLAARFLTQTSYPVLLIGRPSLDPQIFLMFVLPVKRTRNQVPKSEKEKQNDTDSNIHDVLLPLPSQVERGLSHFGWQLESPQQDQAELSWL